MKIRLFALLFALIVQSFLTSRAYADTPNDLKQVEDYIRCFDDANTRSQCQENLANVYNTPFARLVRGEVLYDKGETAEEKRKNANLALADFKWAHEKGYPLAPMAISSIFYRNRDYGGVAYWISQGIETGERGAASYYRQDASPGSSMQKAELLTLSSWVSCHPASIEDTRELHAIWKFGKENEIADFATLLARYRASQEVALNKKRDWFLSQCAENTYNFGIGKTGFEIQRGMRNARDRLKKVFLNIQNATEKFPELRLLSHPEYFAVLPNVGENDPNEKINKIETTDNTTAEIRKGIDSYQEGDCVQAISELSRPAKKGSTLAGRILGDLYSNAGQKCTSLAQNDQLAAKWYLHAAQLGDGPSQSHISYAFQAGMGVTKDLSLAVMWLRKAAEQGREGDLYRLSGMVEKGLGVAVDRTISHMLMTLSVRNTYWSGAHDAVRYLEIYTEKLSPDQLEESKQLSSTWKPGLPLPTTSKTGGHLPSEWYRSEAAQGNVEAYYKLGLIYKNGLEGEGREDDEQSVAWLRKAAQQGHADAQDMLSQMHGLGRGVSLPIDYVLFYMTHRLAAKGGNKRALSFSSKYWTENLSVEQLAEGDALVAQWTLGAPIPTQTKTGLLRMKSTTQK